MDAQKTIGAKGASVLEQAARRRRRTIRWPEDGQWLREVTPAPQRLLSRLKDNGLLYSAGRNRFVIAPPGTHSIRQAASPELLADLAFSPHGDYFVGFLSALIAHRLTDLHSETTYVAMRQGEKPRKVPDGFKVAGLPEKAWPPADGDGIERVRIEDSKEFFRRSSTERTLVDALLRPDLSGGVEAVVTAWARAKSRPEVRWHKVIEIAARLGDAASRRVAFLLRLLGFEELVESSLKVVGRRSSPLLDRSREFERAGERPPRDRETGVLVNVPRGYLRGWIEGAAAG